MKILIILILVLSGCCEENQKDQINPVNECEEYVFNNPGWEDLYGSRKEVRAICNDPS